MRVEMIQQETVTSSNGEVQQSNEDNVLKLVSLFHRKDTEVAGQNGGIPGSLDHNGYALSEKCPVSQRRFSENDLSTFSNVVSHDHRSGLISVLYDSTMTHMAIAKHRKNSLPPIAMKAIKEDISQMEINSTCSKDMESVFIKGQMDRKDDVNGGGNGKKKSLTRQKKTIQRSMSANSNTSAGFGLFESN